MSLEAGSEERTLVCPHCDASGDVPKSLLIESQGLPVACGYYEREFIGMPHDIVQAVNWYRKVITNGGRDAMAMCRLARVYERGRGGLPRDPIRAATWYRQAAALGNSEAYDRLKRIRASRFELLNLRALSTDNVVRIVAAALVTGLSTSFLRRTLA